jgi:hypothetical protein
MGGGSVKSKGAWVSNCSWKPPATLSGPPAPAAIPPASSAEVLANPAIVALRVAFNQAASERPLDEGAFEQWVNSQKRPPVARAGTAHNAPATARRAGASPPRAEQPGWPTRSGPHKAEVLARHRQQKSAGRAQLGTDAHAQPLRSSTGADTTAPTDRVFARALLRKLHASYAVASAADRPLRGAAPARERGRERVVFSKALVDFLNAVPPSALLEWADLVAPAEARARCEHAAVTKLQARARGKAARKGLKTGARAAAPSTPAARKPAPRTPRAPPTAAEHKAAATIQARARAKLQSNRVAQPARARTAVGARRAAPSTAAAAAQDVAAPAAPAASTSAPPPPAAKAAAPPSHAASPAPPPAPPPAPAPAARPLLQWSVTVRARGWAYVAFELREGSVRKVALDGDEAAAGATAAAAAAAPSAPVPCCPPLPLKIRLRAPHGLARGPPPELFVAQPGGARPTSHNWLCRSVRASGWARGAAGSGDSTSVLLLPPARACSDADSAVRAAARGADASRVGEAAPGVYVIGVRLPSGAAEGDGRLRVELAGPPGAPALATAGGAPQPPLPPQALELPAAMASYEGPSAAGLPCGEGACAYADGSSYAGGFWYGRRSGRGVFTAADRAARLRGDWFEDVPMRAVAEGAGAFVSVDGGSGVRPVGGGGWVSEVWHCGARTGVFSRGEAPPSPASAREGAARPLRVFATEAEAAAAYAAEAARLRYSHEGEIVAGRRHGPGRSTYMVGGLAGWLAARSD